MEGKKLQSRASQEQSEARKKLRELFENSPLPTDELLVNLALYMRSSVVAKFLYINELYQLIVHTPGVIMEFGVWWGTNMALFESLRAVYEPYNYTRKIIGFDTFEGYPPPRHRMGGTSWWMKASIMLLRIMWKCFIRFWITTSPRIPCPK